MVVHGPVVIQSSVTLFEILCALIVFASVLLQSRLFREITGHYPSWISRIVMTIFFGPMAAGLICGPVIGIGSGFIGGLFRLSQGGPYMWTGLSVPILPGIPHPWQGALWKMQERNDVRRARTGTSCSILRPDTESPENKGRRDTPDWIGDGKEEFQHPQDRVGLRRGVAERDHERDEETDEPENGKGKEPDNSPLPVDNRTLHIHGI